MATALKILAAVIVVAGAFYLYREFELARMGAITLADFIVRVALILVLAILSWTLGGRIARRNLRSHDIAGTF